MRHPRAMAMRGFPPPTTSAPTSAALTTRATRAGASAWRLVPPQVRRSFVVALGTALIVLGCVLVVLPGPFTIPPILLGLTVLGTEFHWARRLKGDLLRRARQAARRTTHAADDR